MNIRAGGADPKNTPSGADAEYVAKSKIKFQIKTTKQKFRPTTCLDACPGPWKKFGQQNPVPSRPTNSRSEQDESLRPVLHLTKKTHSHTFHYRSSASQPGKLERNGVTGKLSRRVEKHSFFRVARILGRKHSEWLK